MRLCAAALVSLFLAACGDSTPGLSCESCPGGKACASDGVCRTVCSADDDCGSCQSCEREFCMPNDDVNCDGGSGCSDCSANEVCIADQCVEGCTTSESCGPGMVCSKVSGVGYCIEQSGTQVRGGLLGHGLQTSASPSFDVRGAVVPVGGRSTSFSYTVVSPAH